MLNFALSSIPNRAKNVPSFCPALKALILIRNDNLTSEESKAKKPSVNSSYRISPPASRGLSELVKLFSARGGGGGGSQKKVIERRDTVRQNENLYLGK